MLAMTEGAASMARSAGYLLGGLTLMAVAALFTYVGLTRDQLMIAVLGLAHGVVGVALFLVGVVAVGVVVAGDSRPIHQP